MKLWIPAFLISVCVSFAECDFIKLDRKAMAQYRNSESLQEIRHALGKAQDCFESKGLHLIFGDELPSEYAYASFLLYMRILNIALHTEDYDLARSALDQLLATFRFSVDGLEREERALLVIHGWRSMENRSESPRWESRNLDSLLLSFIENLEE
ncbi:MAG: hypothetical protein JJU20_14105 [Opitutales bacterium]|nr:hypothetical protein [Opitutales bacterium]